MTTDRQAELARRREYEAHREQAIEKAARVLAGLIDGEEWPTNSMLGGGLTGTRDDEYRDGLREEAREVLDAILPQVSTPDELEALSADTWLASFGGMYSSKAVRRVGVGNWRGYDFEQFGPLTVVWQPEVTR